MHCRDSTYTDKLIAEFDTAVKSALALPLSEWENQKSLQLIKERLYLTTCTIRKAQELTRQDAKLLGDDLFKGIPKTKTEDQIFSYIQSYKKKQILKEQ